MKKRTCNKGFTFVEMLACVVTLILIAGIVSAGMNLAIKSYNESLFESDSQMLESTLNLYICDILRHATKIELEEGTLESENGEQTVEGFTNVAYQIYGGNIKVMEKKDEGGGAFMVYETKNNAGVMLVGENVYANTLYVSNFTLKFNAEKGYFTGSYVIKSTVLEHASRECTFTCRTIAVY